MDSLETRRVLAFLFVVSFSVIILTYFHNQFWWAPDDGAYAHVAERILDGERLNSDVQDLHFGYINFTNALALHLFGHDLVSLRYPLVLLGVLQACLIFFLLIQQGTLVASTASALITGLSFVQFLNPTAHWYCLFLIITIICILSWVPEDKKWREFIIGFLLITLLLFRQLSGIFVAMGILTYLLYEAPRPSRGSTKFLSQTLIALMVVGLGIYLFTKTSSAALLMFGLWPLGILIRAWSVATPSDDYLLKRLITLGIGGTIAALPLISYHILQGSLSQWFEDTVIAALSLTQLNFIDKPSYVSYLLYSLSQIINLQSITAVVNGLFWVILLLAPAALGFRVLLSVCKHSDDSQKPHPLPLLATFYILVSVHFQIPIYLFYSTGLTLVALVWLATKNASLRKKTVAALFASVMTAISLYYHAAQPLSRGITDTLQGQRSEQLPVKGSEHASLWLDAEDQQLYSELLALIQREVPPEKAILALPVNPELYFLSGRKNPFRFFNSAFGIRNENDLKYVLKSLNENPPILVFHRPDDKYNTPYSSAVIEAIQNQYTLLTTQRGFWIYKLKDVSFSQNQH